MTGTSVRAWRGAAALAHEARRAEQLARDLDPLCNEPRWLRAHAAAFTRDEDLFGWTVEREGEPLGLFPFRHEPERGTFALRRAVLSADGTFDSDYLDLWLAPGAEREAIDAWLDAFARERRVHAVVLSGVPDTSRALVPLRTALERRGLPRRERPGDCLAARLPEDFEEYVAGLKPRMRSKVRQALRAAEEAGARSSWCTIDLEARLDELFELHAKRWSETGIDGSFADERRRALYRDLARAYAESDELRFARLELAGRTLALQFGVRRGTSYYQLQEGFDPAADAFRGATALRALALRDLIAEGVRTYDFMAGGTRHKRDWGGVERPCTTIAFALPRVRARLSYAARAWLDRRAADAGG